MHRKLTLLYTVDSMRGVELVCRGGVGEVVRGSVGVVDGRCLADGRSSVAMSLTLCQFV